MMPSSITRLVEAISNAIAAVKFAPLRNSDRASATAAYEHDEEAAPRPVATAKRLGAVVAEQPGNRLPADDGLHDGGQQEAQDQRPADLPGHRERQLHGAAHGVEQPHGAILESSPASARVMATS